MVVVISKCADLYLILTDFAVWPEILTEKMIVEKKQLYSWLKSEKRKAGMPVVCSSACSDLVKSGSSSL